LSAHRPQLQIAKQCKHQKTETSQCAFDLYYVLCAIRLHLMSVRLLRIVCMCIHVSVETARDEAFSRSCVVNCSAVRAEQVRVTSQSTLELSSSSKAQHSTAQHCSLHSSLTLYCTCTPASARPCCPFRSSIHHSRSSLVEPRSTLSTYRIITIIEFGAEV